MKRKVPLAVLFVLLLGSLPLSAVKKDTKMILDEIQKLADTVAALDAKVAAMAAELAGLAKKSNISDERIGAMSRIQADLAQNREDLMLNMQFFKEELNDIKNSLSKINDRIMNLPAAAGSGTAGVPDNAAGGNRAA
jgi:chromosome segregation ATPase